MKKNNIIKRILCAVLCVCMITGTLLALASCDAADMSNKDSSKTVIVLKEDVPAGTKLTADMFEVVKRPETSIHLNAICDVNNVENKYAVQNLYKGEFIFAGKITDKDPAANKSDYKAYIVLTDEMSNKNGDIATELQRIINKYPGRTIEIPDGEYVLSKPVTVYADPTKAVSIRLSDYAVIKPASNWNSSEAMFNLCVGEIPEDKKLTETFYIQGGLFDGNGIATAISVENAENFFIANVDVKNSPLAFDLKGGILDMENVNIIGAGGDSIGIKAACNTSSFSNVRITDVSIGVYATGDNNLFKSVYATHRNGNNVAGFKDTSRGNNYDMCTSEDFTVGYEMGEGNHIYYGCYAKWTSSAINPQVAFKATGKFNSVIRTTRADFDFVGCNAAYLKVGTNGGAGQILWPMIGGKGNMQDNTYSSYLNGTLVIDR